jgi:hypothetical protein
MFEGVIMQDESVTIVLQGLTPLDADELGTDVQRAGGDPDSTLQVQPDPGAVAGTRRGEPFTLIALMAVSQVALTALTVYLAKGRTHSKRKLSIRHRKPDGEMTIYELEVDASSEEALRADLLKQIGSLRIPLPKLD